MDTIEEKLQEMRDESAEAEKEWKGWLEAHPLHKKKATTCQKHPNANGMTILGRASIAHYRKTGEFEVFVAKCVHCIRGETISGAGVPPNLMHCRFDNFERGTPDKYKACEKLRAFTESQAGFVVIRGGYGSGKSHLAVASLVDHYPQSSRFITMAEFMRQLRRTYQDDYAPDPIERCRVAKLLVIDDLGVSIQGRDLFPAIHEVLAHRYEQKFKTIITTNLEPVEFLDVIGERMADRLQECTFADIQLDGESHRPSVGTQYSV